MSVSEYMWKQRQNQYGSLGNSMPHHWTECQNIRMDLIRKCWHLPPMLSEVKRIWFIFACANWLSTKKGPRALEQHQQVELCVSKLYDDKLHVRYVSKLCELSCVWASCVSWVVCEQVVCELSCVWVVWWQVVCVMTGGGGRRRRRRRRRDTEPKTRTPHKDVGNKI